MQEEGKWSTFFRFFIDTLSQVEKTIIFIHDKSSWRFLNLKGFIFLWRWTLKRLTSCTEGFDIISYSGIWQGKCCIVTLICLKLVTIFGLLYLLKITVWLHFFSMSIDGPKHLCIICYHNVAVLALRVTMSSRVYVCGCGMEFHMCSLFQTNPAKEEDKK